MKTLSTRAKIGFWIVVVLGIADLTNVAIPTQPDGQGPPLAVVIFGAVLGLVTIAAAVWFLRTGTRPPLRVMAVSRILSAISAVPAFFADVPPPLVALAAAIVVLTIVAVVLMMSRPRVASTTMGAHP